MGGGLMGYRGAVIGYGKLGSRHAEVLAGLEQTELVAVCDPVAEARAAAAERYPGIATYAEAGALLQNERLDLVTIATHASARAKLALLAADHGVHAVCEKPMAANLGEADTMLARFAEAGLQLVIDHQWRLGPGAERTAALLAEGAIGRLLTLKVNFCKGRPAGWELAEMGTHVFDMVCRFAGEPRDCVAHILSGDRDATRADVQRGNELNPGGYDSGWVVGTDIGATFRFDSGAMMLAEGFIDLPWRSDRILIEMRGTGGRLRLTGGAFDEIYLAPGGYPEDERHTIPWESVPVPARPERPTMSEFAGTIAPVYEALIHSLETGAPHPCGGVGGRRAMEMISAVFASHFAGGPLSLPLRDRGDPLAPPA